MRWPHGRHVEVAAFATGADARVTAEPKVCAGSCDPGMKMDVSLFCICITHNLPKAN